MDLKFRRNLPLLLLFVAIVTFLVLGLGNQPIVPYTLGLGDASAIESAQDVDLIAGLAGLLGLSATDETQIAFPTSDTAESIDQASVLNDEVFPAGDDETQVNLDGVDMPVSQLDEG